MNRARPEDRGRLTFAAALLLLVLFQGLAGCASSRPAPPPEDAALMEWAREGLAARDYRDVLLALQAYLPGHAGSRYTEEATLLIGRMQYELGMNLEAEEQFRKLLHDFPGGEFAPEATYYLALTLFAQSRGPQLDQTETREALDQFRSFVSRYPGHTLVPRAEEHILSIRSKLAEKEFLNGKLYLRRGLLRPARFYFEERVVKEYGDTRWASPAKLQLARSYEETKEWSSAARWAEDVLESHPEPAEEEAARDILDRARKQVAAGKAPIPPSETSGSSGPR